ncbi:hypothetical protein [Methylobacterium sp. Leaf89]|uniref:hypothetical protein n=1 Tax=Methylobacterium sp. Leaf89 TaxID=1736245 RepID=UPI000B2692EF|nr:hypothetical protein [Methylobacterium sp. Leaf89]
MITDGGDGCRRFVSRHPKGGKANGPKIWMVFDASGVEMQQACSVVCARVANLE